ncbi:MULTISPECIES: LacI family DNA-binding transcriptional regulator [unclassified Ruegeria]|uniref:LacI family DNA-binding transcriptional regulator n=1 Tax=unclassified Ruegeria TaxID=2625375 RepID=UPI001488310D|nr:MULTISPECIES: LacI family DNA-binding transcriptional regulator [unclassified Ruegeria]NOD63387.1 substrate-binding domain-containing protein [Ruegeria sp. HKCCD6109]
MSKHRSAPTLDDVAKAAGVSTATVSRCLNNPQQVVEATRRRVLSAVDALGYTPNFAARVMAAKRSFTIGAIIPTMENAIFARGLQAFQEEIHKRGYTLLVSSSAYKPEVEQEQIRTLVARGADALLLIGHDRDERIYDYLERQKVPALVAWSFSPNNRMPSVGFDNRQAMKTLAQQVIGLGHTRLATISGFSKGNDRARLRIEGIQDAMTENGLASDDLIVAETTYEIENGAEAFRDLMSHARAPTAVLCGNDVLAVGAMRQAQEMGLRVPDDVSITGFDDIELARIVSPALTTVHVPHREMGQKAALELIHMIETNAPGRSVELSTRLICRASLQAATG